MSPRRAICTAAVAGVVIASTVAAGAAPSVAEISAGVSGVSVQPSGSAPGTATAVIKTIAVGNGPEGVAINDSDDTVYVANWNSDYVSVINGRTGAVDDTITVGQRPAGVAVNQSDDTVYITNWNSNYVSVINGRISVVDDTISLGAQPNLVAVDQGDDTVYVTIRFSNYVSVINGRTSEVDDTIIVGKNPSGVAMDQGDDTVYVTNDGDGYVSVIDGRTGDVDDTIAVGQRPLWVAVNQSDDTVYVANLNSDTVSVINGRTGLVEDTIASVKPYGVAVDQADGTVYVANYGPGYVSVIDGRTGDVDDTITVGTGPILLEVDQAGTNQGVVYVANFGSNDVSVLAEVSPSISPSVGPSGGAVTVTLDVPQVGFDVDDATITSVLFNGTPGTGLSAGAGDTWTVTAPSGSGTVAVTVTLDGGLTASAGTFTYGSPTPPVPPVVFPPSAPGVVSATAGDASAEVAWTAPSTAGSFPISTYQAVAAPGGRTCLVAVPALSCMVTGLTNGTQYTFTVRALNGAGWSSYSAPSAAVRPSVPVVKSILIAGSRVAGNSRRIEVEGTSTGLVGQQVTPWLKFPGQASFVAGVGVRTVDAEGGFTWSRRTAKRTAVHFAAGDVRSNTVVIRPR